MDSSATEVERIGAATRVRRVQPAGHAQQMVNGNIAARVQNGAFPLRNIGVVVDTDPTLLRHRANERGRQTLGHRPSALRRMQREAFCILLGGNLAATDHYHGCRTRVLAVRVRHKRLGGHRGERLRGLLQQSIGITLRPRRRIGFQRLQR